MPSTSIQHFDYDSEHHVLSVWFRTSGRRYDYFAVPPEVFEAFRRATSKGRFFNSHIRDRYACEWQAWERTPASTVPTATGGEPLPLFEPARKER